MVMFEFNVEMPQQMNPPGKQRQIEEMMKAKFAEQSLHSGFGTQGGALRVCGHIYHSSREAIADIRESIFQDLMRLPICGTVMVSEIVDADSDALLAKYTHRSEVQNLTQDEQTLAASHHEQMLARLQGLRRDN